MLAQTGGDRHVVNLGHGILPASRIECVEAFFETARAASTANGTSSARGAAISQGASA
jgi:uroporphyrinogen-III decarboxylase